MEATMQPTHIKVSDSPDHEDTEEKPMYSRWVNGELWSTDLSHLPFLKKDVEDASTRKLLPTAWMDGLRGLACFVVFNFHFFFAFDEIAMVGYGANEQVKRWIGLPGIRILYEGVTSVSIFFCISGYVCSVKPLKYMAAEETDKALRSLVTSVFRRYFRLYLPVLFCMVCQAFLAHVGAYDVSRPMFRDREHHFPGLFAEPHLGHASTLYVQLRFTFKEFCTLSELWRPGQYYAYHDPHYWTIPKEFGSGLLLFLALVGLAGCKNSVRLAGLLMFAVLANWYDKFDTMLFLFGAAMAQYEIIFKQKGVDKEFQVSTTSLESSRSVYTIKATTIKFLRVFGYITACYLMSFPRRATRSPAMNDLWVLAFVPQWVLWKEMFVKSIGSMLLIFMLLTSENKIGAPKASMLHRICNSSFALYMGRIMYPFYLIHGTVLHIFGYAIPYWIWAITGQDTRLTWLIGFGTGWIVSFMCCIWLSELFARHVEPRCARFTALIQEWCS